MFKRITCRLQYLYSLSLVLMAAHTEPFSSVRQASTLSRSSYTGNESNWDLVPRQELEVVVSG